MANFSTFFHTLSANEGGYCNTVGDHGGETYRGITSKWWPNWEGWTAVRAACKVLCPTGPLPKDQWKQVNKALSTNTVLDAQVINFYKAQYWNTLHLDSVTSQAIANQMADHGVNAGQTKPALMMQYLLNTEFGAHLEVDGKLGPQSIATLNAANPKVFYEKFTAMRRAFYDYLASSFLPAQAAALAPLHQFFRNTLKISSDSTQQKFLTSWNSRTQEKYVA